MINNYFELDSYYYSLEKNLAYTILKGKVSNRDLNSLIEDLFDKFDGIFDIINQSPKQLAKVPNMNGCTLETLVAIGEILHFISEKRLMNKPALSNWSAIKLYCEILSKKNKRQNIFCAFLDEGHTIIKCEQLQIGTVDSVQLYPREVVSRSLELGASSIIIINTIPSSRRKHTYREMEIFESISIACDLFNIDVLNFVVASKAGFSSVHK